MRKKQVTGSRNTENQDTVILEIVSEAGSRIVKEDSFETGVLEGENEKSDKTEQSLDQNETSTEFLLEVESQEESTTDQQPPSKYTLDSKRNHNEVEKNRRAKLKDCLESLKDVVPCGADVQKNTTQGLLIRARNFIKTLEQKERRLSIFKNELIDEQKYLRRKLEQLQSLNSRTTAAAISTTTTVSNHVNNSISNDFKPSFNVPTTASVGTNTATCSISLIPSRSFEIVSNDHPAILKRRPPNHTESIKFLNQSSSSSSTSSYSILPHTGTDTTYISCDDIDNDPSALHHSTDSENFCLLIENTDLIDGVIEIKSDSDPNNAYIIHASEMDTNDQHLTSHSYQDAAIISFDSGTIHRVEYADMSDV